jgi:broad specificity phosphatase PhoE
MADIVHLIRHGQSRFNAEWERHKRDPMIVDAPLTDLGHEQARRLSPTLAGLGVEAVITSPLTRAIQTTLNVFPDRSVPIMVDDTHREYLWSSCDVGRSPTVLAREFQDLTFDHLNDPWWHCPSGDPTRVEKETLSGVMTRVEGFLDVLRTRPERRIAVVGHCTFFWLLTGHLMQNCEVFDIEPRWHVIPPPTPVPGSEEEKAPA